MTDDATTCDSVRSTKLFNDEACITFMVVYNESQNDQSEYYDDLRYNL